jgi:2-(1,2-epoxy-1,2-dihydrophenyl)acetyl-CoA isomerase
MDKTAEWARKLADGPVKSMGIAKRMVYEAYLMNSDQALDMEGRKQARLLTQPDFFNAVLAFYQKKKPTYS